MAIIKCPECGKEISSLAESCPHCGRPMKKKTTTHYYNDHVEREYNSRSIGMMVTAVIIAGLGIYFIIAGFVDSKIPLSLGIIMGIFSILMAIVGFIYGLCRWHQTH